MKVGCIVLAGGKSSRLGRDKALVELGGKTLLQLSVTNLEFLNSEIIIVAAPKQQLPGIVSITKIKIVRDITFGKGPLIGIYTGLLNSKYMYNFVLACDMPFVSRPLVEHMIHTAAGYDLVIPRWAQGLEPLHAVYARTCLAAVETLVKSGRYKIDKLLEMVRVRYLEENDMRPFDSKGISFFNINTPADLIKAVGMLKEKV